jgi:hypothetical protein
MRRVDRSGVDSPKSLLPGGKGLAELAKARDHRNAPPPADGTKKKSFEYKAYKGDDVHIALEKLFHGKCAYCETVYAASAPVDVEHYRPKNSVSESPGHGGYWWIAMQWENLLPSCIDCNRQRGQVLVAPSTSLAVLAATAKPAISQAGKKDSFPLADSGVRAIAENTDFIAEHPLLLNPCLDDPAASLRYSFDPVSANGLILPTGDEDQQKRGAVSIQIYGLNRLALVQDRTRILRCLEFLGDLVIDISGSIADLETPAAIAALVGTPAEGVASRLRLLRDRTLAEIKDFSADEAPYSSMAKAWLEQFKVRILSTPSATP